MTKSITGFSTFKHVAYSKWKSAVTYIHHNPKACLDNRLIVIISHFCAKHKIL